MKKYLLITLFLSTFFLESCSPNLQNKDLTPVSNINQPELEDINNLVLPEAASTKLELSWEGIRSTSEVNEVINDYIELSFLLKDDKFQKVGMALFDKLEKSHNTWDTSFNNSPYMDLFRSKALPEVKKELKKIDSDLNNSVEITKKLVTKSKDKIKWPAQATFKQSIIFLESILDEIQIQTPTLDLYPDFKDEFTKELKKETQENLLYLKAFNQRLVGDKTLSYLISEIKNLLAEYHYTLDSKTTIEINQADNLGKKIDSITNSESALAAIIEVWLYLDKDSRVTEIKPISKSLYNFLDARSDKEIKCLVDSKCGNLWDFLIKNLFILPKIKSYGVDIIKNKLNERSHSIALKTLETQFFNAISHIDERINSRIDIGVEKGKEQLLKINANTTKYVDTKFLSWLNSYVKVKKNTFNSFQWPTIKISKKEDNTVEFESINTDNSIEKEIIRSYFTLVKTLLEKSILSSNQKKKLLLETINMLFALGGISEEYLINSPYSKG
ncbi:MAG: hypothetical protein KDD45_15255, partial [Bdellovibrionales bacterium]|nr:hypothetical protein [Bdellovibrionales bacterium]